MKNNGFELVANYDNLEASRDRLGFNVGFNFTYINNEVTKFQGGNSPYNHQKRSITKTTNNILLNVS